jgi:hypothetical protein
MIRYHGHLLAVSQIDTRDRVARRHRLTQPARRAYDAAARRAAGYAAYPIWPSSGQPVRPSAPRSDGFALSRKQCLRPVDWARCLALQGRRGEWIPAPG